MFVYRNGKVEDLGPGTASAINSNDQLAGAIYPPGAAAQACRVDASGSPPTIELLGHSQLPGYGGSFADGLNDDGVVVGNSISDEGEYDRAFVHFPGDDPDAGFRDLEPLLLNGQGWELWRATDITNYGSIVGIGAYQGEMRGFKLEPQTPHRPSPLDRFKKVPDALARFVLTIGGAESGGAGIGILPSGKPIPIPPHEWKVRWQEMSGAHQELYIGIAIRRLAEIVSDRERSRHLERVGQEIIDRARAEIQRSMPDGP
jgi:hypothetical protein